MAQGISRIFRWPYSRYQNTFDKFEKFQFISSTSDGQQCTQKVNLDGNSIYEYSSKCPNKLTSDKSIYITANEKRVLPGQIRNFKFFTHDL